MTQRVWNFSAGPGMLPLPVLEEAQRDLIALPGVGASVLEISHRSKHFDAIIQEAEANLRRLLNIPENYHVLFLQGGASLQFAMIPMNLLGNGSADYLITGSWGQKAYKEAQLVGKARVAWDGKAENFVRTPRPNEYQIDPNARYVHFTSNETIHGVAFHTEPEVGEVPLVCDMSSDFLSAPIDITKYALIYAGAQKNAGPAGVTIVIIRDDMVQRAPETLPAMLNYRVHAENKSLYNTPPVFAIYIVMLVTRWLLHTIGGLERMAQINREKARLLYEVIDQSGGFYRGHAHPEHRSLMNVTWRLPNDALEQQFLQEARAHGLDELKGHRSVGGCRASIYNAMPIEGVQALREFMLDFMRRHG
ncbi:MAG: 3-phosphoserine/phosphohydroxythreonine transaminase [Fimbriimonadales bacterium]|nr:3-phosphoserine/phosphohydroxythreonine transaminase [Fimbriimonadales bacterium]